MNDKPINSHFTFAPLQISQELLVLGWLEKPHVKAWFHGRGLENTIRGVQRFLSEGSHSFDAWIGYWEGDPFAFLMTFNVKDKDAEDPDCSFAQWVEKGKKAMTLDLLIGEEKYMGKGLAAPMIKAFIDQICSDVEMIFIDPEATNARAIHVYEKVGFKKIDRFIANWHPVPHILMRLYLGLQS